jgi:hypothetical protein
VEHLGIGALVADALKMATDLIPIAGLAVDLTKTALGLIQALATAADLATATAQLRAIDLHVDVAGTVDTRLTAGTRRVTLFVTRAVHGATGGFRWAAIFQLMPAKKFAAVRVASGTRARSVLANGVRVVTGLASATMSGIRGDVDALCRTLKEAAQLPRRAVVVIPAHIVGGVSQVHAVEHRAPTNGAALVV